MSLVAVDPSLAEPEKHIHAIISNYHQAHPNGDPASREALLARQLLSPNEAVGQFVLLAVGADVRNCGSPSKLFMLDEPSNWITLAVCSTRPFSRGSIHSKSSDPSEHPVIDPAYYSHPLDLDLAGRSIMHALNLAKTEPLHSKVKKDENGNLILHPM